jgi:hypothetical protein
VEPQYLSLQQELVRKMPRKGFGVFGGDPAQHTPVNLMPVSEELDVVKQHDFHFGCHPHFWNMFGCDNQDQVDTMTKTSLALMSIVAGREIPFQHGFHNFNSPARLCV